MSLYSAFFFITVFIASATAQNNEDVSQPITGHVYVVPLFHPTQYERPGDDEILSNEVDTGAAVDRRKLINTLLLTLFRSNQNEDERLPEESAQPVAKEVLGNRQKRAAQFGFGRGGGGGGHGGGGHEHGGGGHGHGGGGHGDSGHDHGGGGHSGGGHGDGGHGHGGGGHGHGGGGHGDGGHGHGGGGHSGGGHGDSGHGHGGGSHGHGGGGHGHGGGRGF